MSIGIVFPWLKALFRTQPVLRVSSEGNAKQDWDSVSVLLTPLPNYLHAGINGGGPGSDIEESLVDCFGWLQHT